MTCDYIIRHFCLGSGNKYEGMDTALPGVSWGWERGN